MRGWDTDARLHESDGVQNQCQASPASIGSPPPTVALGPQNTVVCNAATVYLLLASVFVYCPRAHETHESGVTRSVAVTPATRTTPVHIIAAFLPLRHTHKQTNTPTHSLAPFCCHRTGVTGLCFEEAHSMTTFGPMREETVLSVWVMIDSMLDYSEALVMVNLLHVLVLYSVGVNRSVCLSGLWIQLCAGGKSADL